MSSNTSGVTLTVRDKYEIASQQNNSTVIFVVSKETDSVAVGLAVFFGIVLLFILVVLILFLLIRKRNTGNCASWNCIKIMLSGDRFAVIEAGSGTASLKLPSKKKINASLWDVIRNKPIQRNSAEQNAATTADKKRASSNYDYCLPEADAALLPDEDEGYLQPSAITGELNMKNVDPHFSVRKSNAANILRGKKRGRQAADPLPSLPANSSGTQAVQKKQKPPISRKPSKLRRFKKSNGNNNTGREQSVKDTYMGDPVKYNPMTSPAEGPQASFPELSSKTAKPKAALSPPQSDCARASTLSTEAYYETYDPHPQP